MLSHICLLIGSHQSKYNLSIMRNAIVNWWVEVQANCQIVYIYGDCIKTSRRQRRLVHQSNTCKEQSRRGELTLWNALNNASRWCVRIASMGRAGWYAKPLPSCTI